MVSCFTFCSAHVGLGIHITCPKLPLSARVMIQIFPCIDFFFWVVKSSLSVKYICFTNMVMCLDSIGIRKTR